MRRWNIEVLAWALLGLGVGVLAGAALNQLVGGFAGTLVFWVALIVPVALAFRRSIPRGLLTFRAVDLLYGIVLGGILRISQGLLSVAFGGSGELPSYSSLGDSLPSLWWAEGLLAGGIVGPIIEEFFFRGLLLVVIFSVVRRSFRRSTGRAADAGGGLEGFVAVAATTGAFVLTHQLVAPLSSDTAMSLALLAVVTGAVVAFTGRVWPAVLIHIVFNLTGVGLAVVGTILG